MAAVGALLAAVGAYLLYEAIVHQSPTPITTAKNAIPGSTNGQ